MLSQLGAKIVAMPEAAKAEIRAAFVMCWGNKSRAAEALGIPYRSFMRALDRLQLHAELDALALKHGWPVRRGPGRKA